MADTATQNRALYLLWLRTNFPDLYAQAMQAPLGGLFDSIGSAFNNIVKNVTESLPQLANTYTQYQTQRQLIEANSRRAEQGLPPLVYQNGQLVPMTGGSYSEDDYRIAQSGGMDVTSIVLIGAALFLGAMLIRRK